MAYENLGPTLSLQGPTRSADLVSLPKTLIELYQPYIGAIALCLYINLKCIWESGETNCNLPELARRMQIEVVQLKKALFILGDYGLVVPGQDGDLQIKQPLAQAEFSLLLDQLNQNEAAAAFEASSSSQVQEQDLAALFDFYQKQIGLLGPVQEDKLRYWVCVQGMDVEVIVQAIGEMRKSTDSRRIEYLEGILRNWYNEGILTLSTLIQKRREWAKEKQEKVAKRQRKAHRTNKKDLAFLDQLNTKVIKVNPDEQVRSGIANADAYKPVDTTLIQRWKELFQDEYGS